MINYVDVDITKFDAYFHNSEFYEFLISIFPKNKVDEVCKMYHLGATKTRGVIFWQIDAEQNIRTGKIIRYNSNTGKRRKDINPQWVHRKLNYPEDWELTQCLFGLHLVRKDSSVRIVESEKSAVIMSLIEPQSVWLATGGKYNFKDSLIDEIPTNSMILAYPDRDAFEEWKRKLFSSQYHIGRNRDKAIVLVNWLRNCEYLSQLPDTADIADLNLLKIKEFLNYHKYNKL